MRLYFFILTVLLVSSSCGAVALSLPRLVSLPRRARFLAGFVLAPFFLGAWVGLCLWLAPQASNGLVAAAPLLLSLGVLFIFRVRFRSFLADIWKSLPGAPVWLKFLRGLFILLCALVLYKSVINVRSPVDGYDALQYLEEATAVADRTEHAADFILSRNKYDTHNFVWPAYLAYSQMWAKKAAYPHDAPARAAIALTFLYMLAAVFVLSGAVKLEGLGLLAVIILMQVPYMDSILHAAERDAFRTIPLLVLAASFITLTPNRLKHTSIKGFLWFAVVCACVLSGHSLGAMLALSIMSAWAVWALSCGARTRVLLPLFMCLAGLAIAGLHYMVTLATKGNLL